VRRLRLAGPCGRRLRRYGQVAKPSSTRGVGFAELSRRALKHDFRRFDSGEVRVLLFEGGSEILATFGDRLSGKAAHELEKIGVEIYVNSIVTHIDADGVDVKGPDGSAQHFAAKTKIWAAGVSASPLAKLLADATDAQCDRAGRIKVQPDCSLPGHPEVFVVGDMMNYNDLPGVAEVALQSGLHAAHVIRKRVRNGAEPSPWIGRRSCPPAASQLLAPAVVGSIHSQPARPAIPARLRSPLLLKELILIGELESNGKLEFIAK
jgi:NADH:ubiquinone reductase (H+-translocating)